MKSLKKRRNMTKYMGDGGLTGFVDVGREVAEKTRYAFAFSLRDSVISH